MTLTRLLGALHSEVLERFCAETLGELSAYDLRTGGPLLSTLEVYAECGSATETARRLRTHRNTVRYRLTRAQTLLGADLDDPEVRLRVSMALRAQRLLGARRAAEFVQSAQRRPA